MAMDEIALSAATSLVGAMAVDTWQQAREALITWWRRMRPNQADQVDAAFVDSRDHVLTARRAGDEDAESHVVAAWAARMTELLRDDPALVDGLRRLIDDEIAPLLGREDSARTGSHEFRAEASGHGRVYQAGRDQKIYGP